jgi:hypothetical protein
MAESRDEITHLDGTKIFQSAADREREAEVAATIEEVWNCKVIHFGMLSPIDWFAERHGRVVGLLELKCRRHTSDQYPTVFLNVRKWLSLQLGSIGLGCPAIFVARFIDEVRWISVSEVDGSKQRVAGWKIIKARTDIEPVIEIDIANMNVLRR